MEKIIKCARCGEETVRTSGNQKYCSKCAHERKLAAAREYARAERAKKEAENPKPKTKRIKCARCGVEVDVNRLAVRAKYCPECAVKMAKAKRKEWEEKHRPRATEELAAYDEPEMGTRLTGKCDVCGEAFSYIYQGYIKTRCGLHRYAKADGEHRKKKKPRKSHLDEIQRAAHAAGMSYGKYKAMLAMKEMKKGA